MKDLFPILAQYLKDFISFTRWQTAGLILVSLLNGVTQGVGFLMLIPLFRLFEIDQSPVEPITSSWPRQIIHHLGIQTSLSLVLGIFAVLLSLTAMLRFKQLIMFEKIETLYSNRLQTKLFSALIHSDWAFICSQRVSSLTHVITNDLPVVANGTFFFLQMLANICMALCYMLWAAGISLPMTGIALATSGSVYWIFSAYFSKSLQTGQAQRQARSDMLSVLLDHLNGARLTKSIGTESRELALFTQSVESASRESIRLSCLQAGLELRMRIMSGLILCGMLWAALKIMQLPLVNATILILIFSRLIPMFSAIQNAIQGLIAMLPSFAATQDLHDQALARQENLNPAPAPIPVLTREVRLQNLCFKHKGEAKGFGLQHLNLVIPALQTTAIIGPSGSGKSTLADLIAGLLEPDSGKRFSDDTPINRDNLLSWRRAISYVPQECFLFNDTIRNNVCWGSPQATDQEIRLALKTAAADRFINEMPPGARYHDPGPGEAACREDSASALPWPGLW